MKNLLFYIGIIILAIYIISPIDALTPSLLDDLILTVLLFYLVYKHRGARAQQHREHKSEERPAPDETLTLDDACRVLGIMPDASEEEIKKAYKEKIAMNHPDKVTHLSKELQDSAKELTLRLNRAYEIIKRYKGIG